MKLTDLIPYLKNADKWNELLTKLGIDLTTEKVLIYALDKLELDSEILLIELEKTEDKTEIELNGKKYIQILPTSLAQELLIDISNLKTDIDIAKRLIEYSVNDA